jgi:hypothetical protein
MAAFKPTIAASIPIMIGLSNGDAIRNDIADPNGTFALRKPTVIGIVEHAQKGVSAPNAAPIIFPIIPLPDSFFCILSSDIWRRIYSIIALIKIKRTTSSTVIVAKYFSVWINVFILTNEVKLIIKLKVL